MEALWREQLDLEIETLYSEIRRLREDQQLPRSERLRRISPVLKLGVQALLREAGASRKLHGLEMFSQRECVLEEDDVESYGVTG